VVDEQGGLLGIVTELDLIARNAPLKQPRYFAILSGLIPASVAEYRRYKEQLLQVLATNASELMGRDDLERATITPDDPIDEAMARMLHPEITMLPVLEAGKVIGVITRTDIVRVLEQLETASGEEK
jgi:CBS domain-containing protein